MASGIDKLAKQIARMLKNDSPTGYDTTATVTRVEGGTAWVHIPGGVDETPVRLTINAKSGDNVQVRVSNGRAFLIGNGTAPPTDDVRANEAFNFAGIANTVARKAGAVADRAFKIAGNTAQYFWVTEEGTDTGAHITEKPQEEFLEDPTNGGANLLLRSIGIAIRQGLAELASFSLAGLHVSTYDTQGNEVAIAHLGYGSGKSQGSTNTAPYYSLGRRATGSDIGNYSIAEGVGCEASDYCSHAEGLNTIASGYLAHAEGNSSEATGNDSHAEGYNTKGVGIHTHAEGYKTTARGRYSHTEGLETSTGLGADASHAGGYGTKASSEYQTAIGKFNVEDTNSQYVLIIGNGSSDSARSNALGVYWNGNFEIQGSSTTATLNTSYVTAGSITAYRRGNMVQISADVTVSALSARTTIATLPVGYRPVAVTYAFITSMSEYAVITDTGGIQFNAGAAGRRWFSAVYVYGG